MAKHITREEERTLAIAAKAGNDSALSKLLAAHDGLFQKLARKSRIEFDDALQEIRIAAIESLKTFEPDRGVRFTTYFGLKVRWFLASARRREFVIQPPHYHNIARIKESLQRAAGRCKNVASINTPVGDGSLQLGDFLPSGASLPGENASRNEEVSRAAVAVEILPKRSAEILRRRIGGETLEEIGKSIGKTKERVRQIEKEAKATARRMIERNFASAQST